MKPPAVKTDPLSDDDDDADGPGAQGDIQPVGHDYVEEVRRSVVSQVVKNTNKK